MNTEKDTKNYMDAEELKLEIIKSKELNQPTERFGELMLILHDNVLRHKKFVMLPQDIKDELKSYSLLRIFKRGIITVDSSLTAKKIFNYFSSACMMNMMRRKIDLDNYRKQENEYKDKVIKNAKPNDTNTAYTTPS